MAPARAGGALLRASALEPPDKLEEAARLHFLALHDKVFGKLQINFDLTEDPNAPHGLAVTQLHLLASAGPEPQKSVCLGLAYALLAWDWGRSSAGYWRYLALVRTLDGFDVMVRTLLALARRCPALQPRCLARLLALLGDMAEARWPELERVVLALQRELHPGASWPGAPEALASVLGLALDRAEWLVAGGAAQLSFLWAARWAGALAPEHELRPRALELACALWERAPGQVLRAGPALTWALLHCRSEPRLAEAWGRCLELEEPPARAPPQACLDHLLGAEEQEHLAFTVAAERHEDRYFAWFAARHLGAALGGAAPGGAAPAPGGDAHLADVALCALAAAEGAGCSRPGLWSRLWELAGRQGRLALLFAARRPGYGREALAAALAADPDPPAARAAAVQLARAALPPAAGAALAAALAAEGGEATAGPLKRLRKLQQ